MLSRSLALSLSCVSISCFFDIVFLFCRSSLPVFFNSPSLSFFSLSLSLPLTLCLSLSLSFPPLSLSPSFSRPFWQWRCRGRWGMPTRGQGPGRPAAQASWIQQCKGLSYILTLNTPRENRQRPEHGICLQFKKNSIFSEHPVLRLNNSNGWRDRLWNQFKSKFISLYFVSSSILLLFYIYPSSFVSPKFD